MQSTSQRYHQKCLESHKTNGSFLDQDRDYKEWNLGTLYYLHQPDGDQRKFLKEIVDTRLERCGWVGRVDDLIGLSDYPEGTLGRQLKAELTAREDERKK